MTVTREGDRLFTQANGQPKIEVFPYSNYQFFVKVIEATIEFAPAGANRAEELILNQGGARLVHKRAE
jgi:hypothetical protein